MDKRVIACTFQASAPIVLQSREFGERIGVEKRRLILEHHLSAALLAGPQAEVSLAAAHKGDGALTCGDMHQAENGLAAQPGAFGRESHCHGATDANKAAAESFDQVIRKIRRVARYGREVWRVAMFEPCKNSSKRAREIPDLVRQHGRPHLLVFGYVPVRIDHYLSDLEGETAQRMLGQRQAEMNLKAFVSSPHAAAEAAGEDQSCDLADFDLHSGHRPRMYNLASGVTMDA